MKKPCGCTVAPDAHARSRGLRGLRARHGLHDLLRDPRDGHGRTADDRHGHAGGPPARPPSPAPSHPAFQRTSAAC
ncbi:hypothetical protein GCM10009802_23240 [Streptomyces synnematoformans]|uniref:Uncharacterized protein n=1 Tax=Streptomyces synnematoformans TaxID=415721 RepID=A0ABN2Y0W4_9ACTN